MAAGYALRNLLLMLLVSPLHQPLYYTSPGGGFNFVLQLCIGFGVLLTLPVLRFHNLRFVTPILPSHAGTFIAGCLVAPCLTMGVSKILGNALATPMI